MYRHSHIDSHTYAQYFTIAHTCTLSRLHTHTHDSMNELWLFKIICWEYTSDFFSSPNSAIPFMYISNWDHFIETCQTMCVYIQIHTAAFTYMTTKTSSSSTHTHAHRATKSLMVIRLTIFGLDTHSHERAPTQTPTQALLDCVCVCACACVIIIAVPCCALWC